VSPPAPGSTSVRARHYYETLVLLQQGHYLLAATYSMSSVLTCIGGVLGGMWLAMGWTQRQHARS
jgi:fluoride ion exporter CrcB/FEX